MYTNPLDKNQVVRSLRDKVDGEDEDPTTTTTATTLTTTATTPTTTEDNNDDQDEDPTTTTTTTTTTHKDQLIDDPQDSTTEGNTSVLKVVASSGGIFNCRTGSSSFVQHSVNVHLEMSFWLTISSWILMGVAFKNYCTLVPYFRCTNTFYGTFESDVPPPSTNSPFSD